MEQLCKNFCPHQTECDGSTPGIIFEMLYDGKICYSLAVSAVAYMLGLSQDGSARQMIDSMYDQYIEDRNAGQVEGAAQ